MRASSRRLLLDAFYVSILIWYALAGMMLAPFHGDEPTLIYAARDWYLLTTEHKLDEVLFKEDITDVESRNNQDLRLITGAIPKYAKGIATMLAGFTLRDLPRPYQWGRSYYDNVAEGIVPKPPMLFVGRLPSLLMMIISFPLMFVAIKRLGGRGAAWVGTFVYALNAPMLLNGRRAMHEGGTYLACALVILAGLEVARHIQANDRSKRLWVSWLIFGAACGFAIGAKLNLAFLVLPAVIALLVVSWRSILRSVLYAAGAGVVAFLLVFILNPAWWNQPFNTALYVIRIRAYFTEVQIGEYGGWKDQQARLLAPLRLPFSQPQYFEHNSPEWPNWIGGELAVYQDSGLMGVIWERFGILFYPLLFLGIVVFLRNRQAPHLFIVVMSLLTYIGMYILIVLPWQRYYLLMAPLYAIFVAAGFVSVWKFVTTYLGGDRALVPAQ